MSMKNSNDTSWDRTSDLPICSTAHGINTKPDLPERCSRTVLYHWHEGNNNLREAGTCIPENTAPHTRRLILMAIGVTWWLTIWGAGGGQNRPWVFGTLIYEFEKLER